MPAGTQPKSAIPPTPPVLPPPPIRLPPQSPSVQPLNGPPVSITPTCCGTPPRPVPTSLEYHESNAHFTNAIRSGDGKIDPRTYSPYEHYRHDQWQNLRVRTYETLQRLETSPKTLGRFAACGSDAIIEQHIPRPTFFRVRCNKCRHRLCFPCQLARGCIIQANLQELGRQAGKKLSMLTLTLAHTEAALRPTLARLITAFRDLRRLKPWKAAVAGGAWVLEIKRGKDGLWHPHIHALIVNDYMEQGWISQAWHAVTGDSTQVHIKRIEPHHGSRYVSKYVVKPLDKSVLEDQASFEEFILAVKGTRACSTFGCWRACPLAEREQDEQVLGTPFDKSPDQWRVWGHFDTLLACLRDCKPGARAIFDALGLAPRRAPPCPVSPTSSRPNTHPSA